LQSRFIFVPVAVNWKTMAALSISQKSNGCGQWLSEIRIFSSFKQRFSHRRRRRGDCSPQLSCFQE